MESATTVPELSADNIFEAAALFGIERDDIVEMKEFASYDDKIFRVTTRRTSYIIKCTKWVSRNLGLHIRLMMRVRSFNVPAQNPIPLLPCHQSDVEDPVAKMYVGILRDKHDEIVHVICVSWIDGVRSDQITHSSQFLSKVGSLAGRMSMALSEFQYDGNVFETEWNLAKSYQVVSSRLQYVTDPHHRKIIETHLNNFATFVAPKLPVLRWSICHNDISHLNIIVNPETTSIDGVIDWGETTFMPTVAEIAACCAYFMLNKDKPVDTMKTITLAYHREFPLSREEIPLVFVSACSRVMVSVIMSMQKIALFPENKKYYLTNQQPGLNLLEQTYTLNPVRVGEELSDLLRLKGIKQNKL